ncbi:LppX_LprAFG lipoprotein [Actinomadura sp. 7K507]|uniref:LppX_LprAFG lipoprotein n=1 Tax=Actinomadura sp. 7K507 TaxID=2530365 RepID=UPI001052F707|nr:LppX_LprAFG lipoprotein [Actinomadura sp. 7K507]TDC96055.1 LppX_LprAFG lipoprotein [Actinomadura sp. 7K507]
MIRRFATGVALAAGLALSVTGCGEAGNTVDEAGENLKLTASQVLGKAADKTGEVDSFQAGVSLKVTGSPQGDITQNGTMKYQLKPELAYSMLFDEISVAGKSLSGGEQRLVGQNMYIKLPAPTDGGGVQSSKPWVKMSLDAIGQKSGSGIGFDKLLQESRDMDPLQNTVLLTASKDVKKVGEETVDGVETTRYTGTYRTEDAIAKLPAESQDAYRKSVGASGMSQAHFDLWVDDEQLPRKLAVKADRSAAGSMAMTITYRDYGKPVQIAAPPAGQVTDMPG